MARNKRKRLQINATLLSSAITKGATTDIAMHRVNRGPKEPDKIWECFLPVDSRAYPQILPHILWTIRQLLSRKSEVIRGDTPRCLARVTKFRATSRQFDFLSSSAAKLKRIDAKCFLRWNSSGAVEPGHSLLSTTQHSLSVIWSVKFLAFAVVSRRFHPSSCNTMRFPKTRVHQLVKIHQVAWNSSRP